MPHQYVETRAVRLLRIFLLAVLYLLLAPVSTLSQSDSFLHGRVMRVSDGDTLWVQAADQFEWVQVRFYGVDAPESAWPDAWPAQPFSAEAKNFVVEQAGGKEVAVRLKDTDTYGRVVGEVFINDRSLSRELLKRGLAWWNRKYAPDDLEFKHLQEDAMAAKLGLWSRENPVPPWEHRRRLPAK